MRLLSNAVQRQKHALYIEVALLVARALILIAQLLTEDSRPPVQCHPEKGNQQ
jgi:hypothetical protein